MSTPLWKGTMVPTEQAGSPMWEVTDTIRVTTLHRGEYVLCHASLPPKGVYGTGDYAGLRVESSKVVREKGGVGALTVVYAGLVGGSGETNVPPDENSIEYTDEAIPLDKHPNFAALNIHDIRACQQLAAAKNDSELAEVGWILEEGDPVKLAYAERLARGGDTFALGLPIYRFTTYYVTEPATSAGGFAETPFGPLTAPDGYDWLRKPDAVSEAGAYWKLTRSWQGTYNLDTYLYS